MRELFHRVFWVWSFFSISFSERRRRIPLRRGLETIFTKGDAISNDSVCSSAESTGEPPSTETTIEDSCYQDFDYDLIVIGGGSGGLACSKEASKLGAKVAVLDYVKSSPIGSKWGLGGTCVNVGCIPKKLMHHAALLGEAMREASDYGWKHSTSAEPLSLIKPEHSWHTLRENVQNHIKSLNFQYRKQLREKNVTYINKLGKFVGPHTLECRDAVGKLINITAAQFVVAVGGRPCPLNIPGGEYAITSDDIFMKETPPGKTCVVGAGYVALECAGFLTGLRGGDVTVLVRSMLLRGFDRDLVDRVQKYMESTGTSIVLGATPESIEKLASGRLLVRYCTGESEEFDTVLSAVGRYADTAGLGLEAVGVNTNSANGKIVCKNEQSSASHVYAIGDVVDGAPELTPVAILAGKLLARRLFGGPKQRKQFMNYFNVATAVFTPLELGTVGMTEQEAVSAFGAENVECYISHFTPLEWTLVHRPDGSDSCTCKVVVHRASGGENEECVLGIHIAAPNAGEIIQGFSVALNQGRLTLQDLLDTVGVHPTIAEEFTLLTVSKSSGMPFTKTGC